METGNGPFILYIDRGGRQEKNEDDVIWETNRNAYVIKRKTCILFNEL